MKQGLNFNLAVEFDINLDDVEKVEFIFSNSSKSFQKLETWEGNVKRKTGTNILLVPFTKEETYNFERTFYMDTRITLKKSKNQPETPIIELEMNDTLFEKR